MTALETPRTVVDFLGLASAYLQARDFEHARLDAEILLGDVLGLQRLELYLHHDRPLAPAEIDAFREHLRRRGRGEPVAYLIGTWGFRTITLATDARALVPRPETEGLVELALARLPDAGALLDLGTGSGAIALAVASERPDAAVTGVDADPAALALATENAARLELAPRLLQSDLYDGLPAGERFDVIAANLPYVPDGDERVRARRARARAACRAVRRCRRARPDPPCDRRRARPARGRRLPRARARHGTGIGRPDAPGWARVHRCGIGT